MGRIKRGAVSMPKRRKWRRTNISDAETSAVPVQEAADCGSAAGRARSSLSACAPDEGALVPVFKVAPINFSINEEASPFS